MLSMSATLVETTQGIEKMLNDNPGPISGINAVYQFDLSGEEEGSFQLHLKDGQAMITQGTDTPAQCTLIMSFNNFQKFLAGNLSGTTAFMTGKLKIKGEIPKAIKLETILKQYNHN